MSDTPQYDDDDRVLAAEYALALLSSDEAAKFEARLRSEPALRALYAGWVEDFAQLGEALEPVAPPARMEAVINETLFGAAPRRGFSMGWLWGGVAVAGLAALVYFAGVDRGPQVPDNPTYVAEMVGEDGSFVVTAAYDAARGALYLDHRAGEVPAGRVLELWLIEGENAPLSMGVLPEGRQAELIVAAPLAEKLRGATFAITDEPPGGAPGGVATGSVLAVGQVSDA
ncbi:anti-sigma factor domain-containing protein [Roseovarius sp. C7]|uniref:anti-sigma factor n=1 Tax=Roseovarius sp. C7 TaxID=3398643 RepID=UPI0039F68F24